MLFGLIVFAALLFIIQDFWFWKGQLPKQNNEKKLLSDLMRTSAAVRRQQTSGAVNQRMVMGVININDAAHFAQDVLRCKSSESVR